MLLVFFLESVSPKPLIIPLGSFQIYRQFATGVVDTGGKFAAGIVDTGGKFATAINNASENGVKICRQCRSWKQYQGADTLK